MKKSMVALQKLEGVGKVLSKRLVQAGFDTLAKLAAAGEEELGKVRGIKPQMVAPMIARAAELAGEAEQVQKNGAEKAEKTNALRNRVQTLKGQLHDLAANVRERFGEEAEGKAGKKVEKQLGKVLTSLDKVEGMLETRQKKADKGLVKSEKRLAGLSGAGLDGVGKGLKKARKSLKRVYV